EFAPRVTVPLHFGPWLNVTGTAAFRTTHYGDSLASPGTLANRSVTRNNGEFAMDFRLPTLERFFLRRPAGGSKPRRKYKHTIEPEFRYRYVTGIDHFSQFIRLDADATLADTNEIQYGITQRLWVKEGDDQPQELASWRLMQKRYFDPTFGGAIV